MEWACFFDQAADLINKSKRPILYIGQGALPRRNRSLMCFLLMCLSFPLRSGRLKSLLAWITRLGFPDLTFKTYPTDSNPRRASEIFCQFPSKLLSFCVSFFSSRLQLSRLSLGFPQRFPHFHISKKEQMQS